MTDFLKPSFTGRKFKEMLEDMKSLRYYDLHIAGMEVSQSIQHYWSDAHLTDPDDWGLDNSVRLISGKATMARVYVRSGLLNSRVFDVTGTLEVLRRQNGGMSYAHVTTLSPIAPKYITAEQNPSYWDERSSLSNSLNFIIPQRQTHPITGKKFEVLCGMLRLRATISTAAGQTDTFEAEVNATLEQSLRLRAICLAYDGPEGAPDRFHPIQSRLQSAAPTLADLKSMAALALRMFPVQSMGAFSRVPASEPLSWHLQDEPKKAGKCSPNWNRLVDLLAEIRLADGNRSDWLYCGLLPFNTPVGKVGGCGGGGIATVLSGDSDALAHEIGHVCGLEHAPCGAVGTVQWGYPEYEPYDAPKSMGTIPIGIKDNRGSIGEFGLDVGNGFVFPPDAYKDFMSYCWPKWISLFSYGFLYANNRLFPRWVCRDEPYWGEEENEPRFGDPGPQPLIAVIGTVLSPERVEVTRVMRLEATSFLSGVHETDLEVQLLDENGIALAASPLWGFVSTGHCACGGAHGRETIHYPFTFQACMPDAGEGSELVICKGELQLWQRRAPARKPVVEAVRARIAKNKLTLTWRTRGENDLTIWAQLAGERDKSWSCLGVRLEGTSADFDLDALPSGRADIRLLVSDGFNTVISQEVSVNVPRRPPEVSILTPRDGERLFAGQSIRIWGMASASDGAEIGDGDLKWLLDGRPIGGDGDQFIEAPAEGRHELKLIAADGRLTGEASVVFKTRKAVERERGGPDTPAKNKNKT